MGSRFLSLKPLQNTLSLPNTRATYFLKSGRFGFHHMLLLLAALLAVAAQAQPSLPDILSRVAEEAEMLRENAPK